MKSKIAALKCLIMSAPAVTGEGGPTSTPGSDSEEGAENPSFGRTDGNLYGAVTLW